MTLEEARQTLAEELGERFIVGENRGSWPEYLHVYCETERDVERVPWRWNGYEVLTHRIGNVKPAQGA